MPNFANPPVDSDFETKGQPLPSFPWEQWFQAITSRFNQLTVPLATPKSSSAPGVKDSITYDQNFVYVCVAPNVWKRSALTSF